MNVIPELNWPRWAQPGVPLFRALFGCCGGNYRVHCSNEGGEGRIEISLTITPKIAAQLPNIAKPMPQG